jgi:hypothetical protein
MTGVHSNSIQASPHSDADRYGTGWLVLRFLFALIVGYGAVVGLRFASIPLVRATVSVSSGTIESSPIEDLLPAALTSLCAGILSGWMMGPPLRQRRWRFLYLAAASPALPIWLTWVAEFFDLLPASLREDWYNFVIVGLDIPELLVFCLSAFTGAAAGFRLRYLRRTGPRLLAHIFVALTAGFAVSLCLFVAYSSAVLVIYYWPRTFANPPGIRLFQLVFYLPPFCGGIPCGFILQPAVSGRRWRFLYLAATSLVFPVWAVVGVVQDLLPWGLVGTLATSTLLSWLGTLVGYAFRHGWHTKRMRSSR